MNRQERRAARAQSQGTGGDVIRFQGTSYTLNEAGAMAIEAYNHGQFQTAADIYQRILTKVPGHVEVHNNLGVSLQRLKHYDKALDNFNTAILLHPNHVMAYYNRGITLNEMRLYEQALASYDAAIALQSNHALGYYNRGITLYHMKRYEEALASYDKAIELNPSHAEYHDNRAVALLELKRYNEALASCAKAITLRPDHAEAYYNQGSILQALKRHEEALASYDKAISLKTDYPEAYINRGNTLQAVKRYEEALASYDTAIALDPDCAEAYHNRGDLMVSIGDMREAEHMFAKALAHNPESSNTLYSLAHIRKYRDSEHSDIRAIKSVLAKPSTSASDREYLHFCLGKMYDDCGQYDQAFENYRHANKLGNARVCYDPDKVVAITNGLIEVFGREFLSRPFAFSSESRSPVFVVGMPRSGTTLMASILSNHPSIATAGELTTIAELTTGLPQLNGNGIPYPQAVKHMTPATASMCIHTYEKRLRRDAGPEVLHVVDKYPVNFRHLGFITMLFSKAVIVHCTRNCMDTILSNYFQRFTADYDYSFDLRNIVYFYKEYERLMEHWRNALPTPMIEISYESMTLDTETVVRPVLDALGLEWDERCLSPHTNPSAVETASKWQVRQPIYKQSVERWRHYEKYLQPLKEVGFTE